MEEIIINDMIIKLVINKKQCKCGKDYQPNFSILK